MKHLLTTLLLILSTVYAAAQGPVVDIATAYGLDHITGARLLRETGTITQAQATYPHTVAWARNRGWTNAEILELCHVEAAWHNAFWGGENGNYSSPAPGHAINIEVPAGRFPVVFPLPFAQGIYQGQGSRFSDRNGSHTYGSTEFFVDHPRWRSNLSADRLIMRSANWGTEGGYGAWNHHFLVQHLNFNGRRRTPWMPTGSAESAGIGAWDSGETSHIRHCYFSDFEKDGILLVRGTPAKVENCSMFTTSRFGIALVGGGSLTCDNISGDESGIALVGVIPGYNRPGSGKVAVFGAKQETSTSAEFRPWKGSSFMYVEGWVSATVHGVSYASSWTNPYDFISWRRGPGNFSQIEVTGTLFFGNAPRCLFYDETNDREYRFEGNAWQNSMQSFVWHEQHGLKTPWKTIAPVVRSGPKGRLQHVGQDGATDWASARVYDPTGGTTAPPPPPPPPPACTYTAGPWSECIGGTRTRTVTASPAGCVGTPPASSEPCTVEPPPPPPEPEPVGTWQVGPWSSWSRCSGFRQTRTRTVECVGGLCPSPQPATSESRGCLW
jgi:hypothetical protein